MLSIPGARVVEGREGGWLRGLEGITSGRGMLVERWQYTFKNRIGQNMKKKKTKENKAGVLMTLSSNGLSCKQTVLILMHGHLHKTLFF